MHQHLLCAHPLTIKHLPCPDTFGPHELVFNTKQPFDWTVLLWLCDSVTHCQIVKQLYDWFMFVAAAWENVLFHFFYT